MYRVSDILCVSLKLPVPGDANIPREPVLQIPQLLQMRKTALQMKCCLLMAV